MPTLTDLAINTQSAQIERLAARIRIPNVELRLMDDPTDVMRGAVLEMERKIAYIPGPETIDIPEMTIPEIRAPLEYRPRINVPATWWDHFKHSNFDILLRWFPVRTKNLQTAGMWGGQVLQEKQTIGGKNYAARAYLPDLHLPKNVHAEYRWYTVE